jgi:ribonuclease P protein subunit RPR2
MNGATKQVARQRVQILFQQAKNTYKANPELASRYVETARKIAMSARMRLPTVYKRQACRECNAFLVPGETSRVRIKPRREPHVVVTCLKCGGQTRIPLRVKLQEKTEIEQDIKQDETSR